MGSTEQVENPHVVQRQVDGRWLAYTSDGKAPRIGVEADSEAEVRALYAESRAKWRALIDATTCACAPDCVRGAEQTEHSPYMDDYCHDCTMHRCDAVGGHVAHG